jgi:hypothetical protein
MALISHALAGFAVAAARLVAILVIVTLDAGPGVGALNGCSCGGLDADQGSTSKKKGGTGDKSEQKTHGLEW